MSNEKNTTTRRKRLTKQQRHTTWLLRRMFERDGNPLDLPPDKGERISVGIHLKRLTEDAGIDRAGMSIADTYRAAMRAITDPNNTAALGLERVTEACERRHRSAESAQPRADSASKIATATTPTAFSSLCKVEGDDFAPLGLHNDDFLMMDEVSLQDVQPDELVHVMAVGEVWVGLGYFESSDTQQFHITISTGETYDYQHTHAYRIFRVTAIFRSVPVPSRQNDCEEWPEFING